VEKNCNRPQNPLPSEEKRPLNLTSGPGRKLCPHRFDIHERFRFRGAQTFFNRSTEFGTGNEFIMFSQLDHALKNLLQLIRI
jgi:hypothetical protein